MEVSSKREPSGPVEPGVIQEVETPELPGAGTPQVWPRFKGDRGAGRAWGTQNSVSRDSVALLWDWRSGVVGIVAS